MTADYDSDLSLLHSYIGLPRVSDREFAIVFAAYVEKHLGNLLKASMPKLNNKLTAKMFEGQGILATANARLDMSAALGLLEPNMHHDMVLIARVRNRFAHNLEVISFEEAKVSQLIAKMRFFQMMVYENKAHQGSVRADWARYDSRTRFEQTSWSMCSFLHRALSREHDSDHGAE